jgi:hypothetical protein
MGTAGHQGPSPLTPGPARSGHHVPGRMRSLLTNIDHGSAQRVRPKHANICVASRRHNQAGFLAIVAADGNIAEEEDEL